MPTQARFFVLTKGISIVGPRPALLLEVVTYDAKQRQRLLVKPGITCYWQTRRNRDSITFDEWVDLDLWDDFESFKADLEACIVHWNTRRRQKRLKGLTPEEFRNQSLMAV